MKIRIIYTLLIAVIAFSCNTTSNKPDLGQVNIKPGLDDEFLIKGFNCGVEIGLSSDYTFYNKTFSFGCMGGIYIKKVIGSYATENNFLSFNPQKIIIIQDDSAILWDTITNVDTIDYYKSDSTKIQTKYWLVKTSSINFLISEAKMGENDESFYKSSNFIALANNYNSYQKTNTKQYLLADKDTIIDFRELDIDKYIPDKWKSYFLSEPLNAKILAVKVIDSNNMFLPKYRLNIGSKSGVKPGMKFYTDKYDFIDIEIMTVDSSCCIGIGDNIFYKNTKLEKGTILSTKKP